MSLSDREPLNKIINHRVAEPVPIPELPATLLLLYMYISHQMNDAFVDVMLRLGYIYSARPYMLLDAN